MSEVLTERDRAVVTITLNRPEVFNAFNAALHAALRTALEEAADPEIRAVQEDDCDRAVALNEDELAHFFLSTKRLIAAFGSSVAIESASQSRAWLIVSCHEMSRHQFSCCFA